MSRPRDLSQLFPKTSYVVPPRMNLYIKRNMRVNNIFKRYVAEERIKEELGLIATVGVAEIIPFGQTRLRQ